jgi:hypothetical protein
MKENVIMKKYYNILYEDTKCLFNEKINGGEGRINNGEEIRQFIFR